MSRFSHVFPYVQVAALLLAGLTTLVELSAYGMRFVVEFTTLALLLILVIEAVSARINRQVGLPSMVKTLTICSWLLLLIGVLMTCYFILPRTRPELSWVAVTAWALLPFALILSAIRRARGVRRKATVLVAALFLVAFGFSFYFDTTYIHISPLDYSPIEVPFVQSLVAGATWLSVCSHRDDRILIVT